MQKITLITHRLTTDSLQSKTVQIRDILILQWHKVISTQQKLYFESEFWSFTGLMVCGTILSPDASASRQPQDHKVKQLIHLQPFCTHSVILFFTFSTVLKKLYEIFNILLWNRPCVRWCGQSGGCYKCSEHS